jgi:predicted Kef-type K+ transport protein
VLLFQDLAVVVLLMLIPLLAPDPSGNSGGMAKIATVSDDEQQHTGASRAGSSGLVRTRGSLVSVSRAQRAAWHVLRLVCVGQRCQWRPGDCGCRAVLVSLLLVAHEQAQTSTASPACFTGRAVHRPAGVALAACATRHHARSNASLSAPACPAACLSSTPQALGIAAVKAVLAIVAITVGGRLVIRPLYRKISNLANAEIFSATTLLMVLGTSFMTQLAGVRVAGWCA